MGDRFQVSCNLIAPDEIGPAEATALVADAGRDTGVTVEGCELVGLVPQAVLDRIDPAEWSRLDLAADRTIEARIRRRGSLNEPAGTTGYGRGSGGVCGGRCDFGALA